MSPAEMLAAVQTQPFEPFRIVMSSGSAYDVDSPLHVIVAARYVHVGIPANPGDALADRIIRLDLLHVTEIVPRVQPPRLTGNGNGQHQ